MRTKTKSEIEYRLNDIEFRKGASEFKKIPTFIFEIIFLRDRIVADKCLMLLTSSEVGKIRFQNNFQPSNILDNSSPLQNQKVSTRLHNSQS